MKKYALFLIAAFLFCSSVFAQDFLSQKQVKLGAAVEDFTLQDLQGNPVELSQLKGKVVMLHFWSAQCPFVIRYEDRLHAITREYKDKNVVVYGIASNVTETKDQMIAEVQKRHINYSILLDPDHKIADRFGAITTPHVFILNQEGKLVYEGAVDDQGYSENNPVKTQYARQALDATLAGNPVPHPQTKSVGCTVKRH